VGAGCDTLGGLGAFLGWDAVVRAGGAALGDASGVFDLPPPASETGKGSGSGRSSSSSFFPSRHEDTIAAATSSTAATGVLRNTVRCGVMGRVISDARGAWQPRDPEGPTPAAALGGRGPGRA
jgi:hypothetical protein